MKKNLTIGLALAVILALVLSTVALADTVVADGDILTSGNQSAVDLGIVTPGAVLQKQVSFTITCDSKQHVDQGQVVNLTASAQTVPSGGALSATDTTTVAVPVSWPDDTTGGGGNTNCPSPAPTPLNDTGNSVVTITAPTAPGSYSYVIRYEFSFSTAGNNDNSALKSNHEDVTYTLTVPAATNTAPTLNLPGNQADEATGPSGAAVDFTVTASDTEDGSLTPTCDWSSGDTFPLGTTTVSCSVTDSGGLSDSGTFTVTVVDTTKPVLSLPGDLTAEATGPTGAAVTFLVSATDLVDGTVPVSCSATSGDVFPLRTTTVTCSATDAHSNTANGSFTITVKDTTPPAVTCGSADGQWHATDVSIACTASDLVGLADPADASFSLSTNVPSNSEDGNASTDARNVCDTSNNCAPAGPISGNMVDKKAPVVSCGSADSFWHATDQTVTCTAVDGGSGPASQTVTLSTSVAAETETDNAYTGSQSVSDNVGNSATAGPVGPFKIDKKAPTDIHFTDGSITDGASYYFGFVPAGPTTCDATDLGSGLASCVVSGGGTSVGAHSYTALATDNVGNHDSFIIHYTVLAWTLNGFYQPVDMGSTVWNTVKGGSTVPLKFNVFAGSTELTGTGVVKGFTATPVACPNGSFTADAIEVTTTGGTSLRYDTVAHQFIQNWQTPKKPGACYVITMTTQDGSSLSANFILK